MTYIHRKLERKFLRTTAVFKAVLVTGARQVGKTTMLKKLAEGTNRTYVTMDNGAARTLAQTDPVLFFQRFQPPILIDEIQKAPKLLEQIKIMCDESDEAGLFWLTGSQQFAVMKHVRESLAGRVGILNLYSYLQSEAQEIDFGDDFTIDLPSLLKRSATVGAPQLDTVFTAIWRGGMPAVQEMDRENRETYYNSYIETYLMRDAVELGGVKDMVGFRRFLTACAALASEPVNYKRLAEVTEVSQPTAKDWLHLLESMGIVFLLQPFAHNALKRLTKTPKLYFCDTGLCAYLASWPTAETLMNGAAAGHYFENFVVSELKKMFAYEPTGATLSYYRDSNAKEVDIFIEKDGYIHPFEIKKSATPDRRIVKKYDMLDNLDLKRGYGGVLCMAETVMPIDQQNAFVPINVIG